MKKSRKSDRQRHPHFPFEDPPFRLSMGLVKIPESEWFEIFDYFNKSDKHDLSKFLMSMI